MDCAVLQCIQVRKDFFEKYYTVPSEVKPEVDAFLASLYTLGEQAKDSVDFEAKFAAEGFQDRLTGLLVRCTPKPYEMTAEEKKASNETAKELFKEDRGRIVKEAAAETVDYGTVMAKEELIAVKRQIMVEAGVYDDYTRATNAADMITETGGFLKNLFKKKKD